MSKRNGTITKARPILFSAPMVRALLAGTKTQTRRALKPQPRDTFRHATDGRIWQRFGIHGMTSAPVETRFAVGDLLWVRETHAYVGTVDPGWLLFRADGYEAECARHGFTKPYPPESEVRWRPSIHMPRATSRLTLFVTDVRVERLQDISHEDAVAEGVGIYPISMSAQKRYREIWDTINGAGSWAANPWVAAYTFVVHRQNVDALLAAQGAAA